MTRRKEPPPFLVVFAAIMLFTMGTFALVAALASIVNHDWVQDASIFGASLPWVWYAILDAIIAAGAFYGGYAIMVRKKAGYWLGIIFATLSALRWFLVVAGVPFFSLTMVILWGAVVYGLVTNEESFE